MLLTVKILNIFQIYLSIYNEKVTDTKIMADLFNNYFSQVGIKMASTIPDIGNSSYKTYLLKNYRTRFKFEPVAEEQIKKIFQSLNSKTSYGYDGLSTKLLKRLEPILCAPIITLIVNQSLNTGIFPDNLKQAKIIPFLKRKTIILLKIIDQSLYCLLSLKLLKE